MHLFSRKWRIPNSASLSFTFNFQLLKNRCFASDRQIIDSKYSNEECQRILKHFNESTAEELQISRLLNAQKAIAIYKYRELNGPFSTIADVLNVSGVGIMGLEKYCNVVKFPNTELAELKLIQESKAFSPTLSTEQIMNIKDTVALDLQFDRVTWTHLGKDFTIKDWSYSIIFDKPYQKFDHGVFMEKLQDLQSDLPKCDMFLMENKLFRLTNLKMVPLVINYRVMEAMLMTLLTLSSKSDIITCKAQTIGKHFGLTVGGERVSGINIVKDVINNRSSTINCVIPPNLSRSFHQADNIQQEYFTNSFLLAFAFQKLVIDKARQ